MSYPNKPNKVAPWIRCLALLYLACVVLMIVVSVQRVVQGLPISLSGQSEGFVGWLLLAYMSFLFCYVAVTGMVPVRFFPVGALTWPHLRALLQRKR